MFLKKIELYGFKSFFNRKDIILNGGITGIVGPNGSGKSNIADALRWVLGEQSSKALRGTSMRDVIFNGTQTKPQKGYCEVSLTFDNIDNSLNTEYAEVCVKRKMYRSGESEYSINNNSCRLKDILNFFRDTGIGKEGYSIIGQGRIDEILDNKPLQRRRVFEEAAGISKFRARKEEAENNLQKTQANLLRIEDILAELELQLEPLKEQMLDAKHYIEITEKLKILETNICLFQYTNALEKIASNNNQINLFEREIAEITKDQKECSDNIEKIKIEIDELQSGLDQKNHDMTAALRKYEKLKGDRALIEERISFNKNMEQENYDKLVSLSERIKDQSNNKEKYDNEILEIEFEKDKLNNRLTGITQENENLKLAAQLEKAIDEHQKESEKLNSIIAEYEKSINEKIIELDFINDKIRKSEEKLNPTRVSLSEAQTVAQNEERNIQEIADQGEKLVQELNDIKHNISNSEKSEEETRQKLNITKSELDKSLSRLEVIKDISERREGYFESVKKLLNSAESEQFIKNKIIGTVADLIRVSINYEISIEIALGNALQNIIVKCDSDAKIIIDFLRKNNIGRITFLPVEDLNIRSLSQKERELLNEPGIIGVAAEIVNCENEARKAVNFLLGRTIIAQDLDSAIRFAKKTNYSLRTVTIDGDIIAAGGAVTGGSIKKQRVSLLSRSRAAEELAKQIEELKTAYDLCKEELDCRIKDAEVLTAAKEEKESRLNEFKLQNVAVRQSLIASETNIERIQNELENIESELNSAYEIRALRKSEIDSAQTELTEFKSQFSEITSQIESLSLDLKNVQALSEKSKEEAEQINEKLTQLNHQAELNKLESEHLNISISTMENTIHEYKAQNEKMAQERASYESENKELTIAINKIEKDNQSSNEETQEILETRKQKQKALEEIENRTSKLNFDLNTLIEKKYKLINSNEKAEAVKMNAQTKLWDTYALTYSNALELKTQDFSYDDSRKECEIIKSEIRKMGMVNPNAIEDYKRIKERYDSLNAQKNDLIKAADDIKIVIGDLTDNMARNFKEKFEQIDAAFSRVFTDLFGGGKAALKLQNENDIMECGIDIAAEPPGKKLQNISLLSGGEKALTAIALLFAMLKINPSPVCLLDEIDAPLDDTNLIRFSDYLRKLSAQNNQFIVITHRKPTMSACDSLYGVAMHEKGISDLVSVKIS